VFTTLSHFNYCGLYDTADVPNISIMLMNVTLTELYDVTTYTHPYAPRHDFNAMDCTDIVIGSARGTTSRIWDYYTRDR